MKIAIVFILTAVLMFAVAYYAGDTVYPDHGTQLFRTINTSNDTSGYTLNYKDNTGRQKSYRIDFDEDMKHTKK